MGRWFRFYDEALDDPKVQRLRPELFKAWVNILCMASRNKGNVTRNVTAKQDVAFHLRCTEGQAETTVLELLACGLLVRDKEWLRPYNWDTRQYVSDTSNQRVKAHRERKRNANCNVTGDVTEAPDVTPPETEPETETDKIINPDGLIANAAASAPVDLTFERDRKRLSEEREKLRVLGERWNTFAGSIGLPQIEEIEAGSARERAALARIREGRDFDRVFAKIKASPFLRGERGSSPCSFNWICNPTNYLKIVEGNYDEVRQAQRR